MNGCVDLTVRTTGEFCYFIARELCTLYLDNNKEEAILVDPKVIYSTFTNKKGYYHNGQFQTASCALHSGCNGLLAGTIGALIALGVTAILGAIITTIICVHKRRSNRSDNRTPTSNIPREQSTRRGIPDGQFCYSECKNPKCGGLHIPRDWRNNLWH
ncbi:hypothetical protein [Beihai hermit crab virus 4]|uniref:Uncharacterized protein n=1 Tax=Beihai hermit crab virus 4 TaxID=1922391 RepID=A0A1L3KIT9_9NIDO|nr:hypothetical protein [Beihai hermit crab virus 4]APG77310.1 hypothetical protein [Beihai hermit crab virus 4]